MVVWATRDIDVPSFDYALPWTYRYEHPGH